MILSRNPGGVADRPFTRILRDRFQRGAMEITFR